MADPDRAARDPDALQHEIERTRADLAMTIDAIADRVNPKKIARRGVARVRAGAEDVVESIGLGHLVGRDGAAALDQGDRPGLPPGSALGTEEPLVLRGQGRGGSGGPPSPQIPPAALAVTGVVVAGLAYLLWRRSRRRRG